MEKYSKLEFVYLQSTQTPKSTIPARCATRKMRENEMEWNGEKRVEARKVYNGHRNDEFSAKIEDRRWTGKIVFLPIKRKKKTIDLNFNSIQSLPK